MPDAVPRSPIMGLEFRPVQRHILMRLIGNFDGKPAFGAPSLTFGGSCRSCAFRSRGGGLPCDPVYFEREHQGTRSHTRSRTGRPHETKRCANAAWPQTAHRARRIIGAMEELAGAARAAREPLSGTVHMGVIPTVGPYLLPQVLPRLRRSYCQLRLYLVEDLTARLVEAPHQGKLDVVLLALPCDCGAVETTILFEDPFLVALPKGHALLNEDPITPQHLLCEELLLLKDGHCLREHALTACSFTGRQRTEAFEATSLATLVQMADNGFGATLLPVLAVDACSSPGAPVL